MTISLISLTSEIASLNAASYDLQTSYSKAITALGGYHSLGLGRCEICFEWLSDCTCYQGCTDDCHDEDLDYSDPDLCPECGQDECDCEQEDERWSRGPRHNKRTRASRW